MCARTFNSVLTVSFITFNKPDFVLKPGILYSILDRLTSEPAHLDAQEKVVDFSQRTI
jgi:hypothetical protein